MEMMNLVFTIVFTFEIGFKLVALPPRKFVQDHFNIFDMVVVVLSWVEGWVAGDGGGGVSALRAGALVSIVQWPTLFKRSKQATFFSCQLAC